jgi:hypothetical protein
MLGARHVNRSPHGGHISVWDWIDLRTLRILARHTSVAIPSLGVYWLVGKAVEQLVDDPAVKARLSFVEGYVIIGLFVFFAVRLGVALWRTDGNQTSSLVALAI